MDSEKKKKPIWGRKVLSLNKRLALITVLVLVPMIVLVCYLMYVLNSTNHAFDEITDSITYANSYATEFKERMDYSMYLAVIRGETVDKLEEGQVTVNGVEIVNPFAYSRELNDALNHMEAIATVSSNKELVNRMRNTLRSLNKRVLEVDNNLKLTGHYDENLDILRGDIYGLTGILEEGLQDYISTENSNFANVRADMIARSQFVFKVAVLVVLLISLLAVFLSWMASRSVTKPIKQLCHMARQLAKGDFTARTQVEAEDEISVLTDSFNDMAGEIGELIDGIKVEQDNLRFTESKLLQAQINPHFLYNTLDTIVWLAEAKQTEDVVSMVTWLSDFFRTTLSKGKDFITVEEERSHIESYLKIQRFRYQDIMDYEIDIDDGINMNLIPKLTLQPLVENALYHGIKMKRGKGKIIIQGFQSGRDLIFKVIDNGKGMDTFTLESLKGRIASGEVSDQGGFGLTNVNQRIHFYYGEEYGMTFDSIENTGTEVTIRLGMKNITTIS